MMNTFIRVAEIWVPDSDGYLLEFGGGVYDNAPEFGAVSRSMCFGRGEGLPGRVWDEGIPIILKDLQGSYFQRAAAAKAAQLTCAIAFPVFVADRLTAVVVLFCGHAGEHSGAIELWRNDPRVTTDMTLRDGVYGAGDAAFEAASRQTFLPRGSGLPGLAWQRQGSVFIDDLSESARFLRSEEAAGTRLRSGFAIPCPAATNENYVLAFLSSTSMPIAALLESWTAGDDGQPAPRAVGPTATDGPPGAALAVTDVSETITEVLSRGVPKVRSLRAANPPGRSTPRVTGAGLRSLVAIPVVSDGGVVEAIALYF